VPGAAVSTPPAVNARGDAAVAWAAGRSVSVALRAAAGRITTRRVWRGDRATARYGASTADQIVM